ncbi:MAG: YihY/virulence factor BrkB family protein [Holophagales bacterium]|nr:YihY/virulence factor BrkB family protein [Holophagales bacterium]
MRLAGDLRLGGCLVEGAARSACGQRETNGRAEILAFLGEILRRCALHSIDTQSAALAFYSLFALAPVLLVILSIAGRYFAEGQARREIVRQLQGVMGPETGSAVAALLEKATGPGPGAGSSASQGSWCWSSGPPPSSSFRRR